MNFGIKVRVFNVFQSEGKISNYLLKKKMGGVDKKECCVVLKKVVCDIVDMKNLLINCLICF